MSTTSSEASASTHGRTVVAILGAGVMGETLLSGLLRSGRPVDDLVVSERRPERIAELHERDGRRGRIELGNGGPLGGGEFRIYLP